MGRCTCPPIVNLNPSVAVTPKLLWFPVTKKGRSAGDILVAAELLLKDKVNNKKVNILQLNALKIYLRDDAVLWPQGG